MKLTKQTPIYFHNQYFYGIKYFDCNVLHFFTEPTLSGTYFTSLPISSLEYRKIHSTKSNVRIEENSEYTTFFITDDHGRCNTVYIFNELKDEIEFAKKSAIELELMKGPENVS